ncbi:hypothetical protein D9615_002535 [Tricholomella constricta]|uniref:Uncharacterized protein n=1 Tax=Tricholomella constricta TaxID=117010 RepID=A0A8H5M9K0_9AGAR|nr:hypothetical protein D9615_002535 [Tricholomella constricta]
MIPSHNVYEPTRSLTQVHPSNQTTPLQHSVYAQMPASPTATLQNHHEALMPGIAEPEPLSAYARWKIEEDERFYATFPQARHAADQYNIISSAYLEGTGYYYDVDGRVAIHAEPNNTSNPSSLASSNSPSGELSVSTEIQPLHYSYDCLPQPGLTQAPVSVSTPHIPRDRVTRRSRHEAHPSNQHNASGPDPVHLYPYGPFVEVIQTNVVVPSQHTSSHPEPPYMDYLPSPTSSTSSSTSTLYEVENHGLYQAPAQCDETIHSASQPSRREDHYPSHHIHAHQDQRTSYNFYPTNKLHYMRPAGWPTVRSPSPRGIRLSPLPPSRRPLAKKPPLACLFCRGRKIACGPPDPGSSDRSCK